MSFKPYLFCIKSLPNITILDLCKLKAIADDNSDVAKILIIVSGKEKSVMETKAPHVGAIARLWGA